MLQLSKMPWFAISALLLQPSGAFGQDAELQKKINSAIDRGVNYLKRFDYGTSKDANPMGLQPPGFGMRAGAMAMAGWTLLESGVSPKDKIVHDLAEQVRQAAPSLTFTYSLALSLIFLEKLDDPGDFALLESFAVRLIAGQTRYGGWDYHCPRPDQEEAARLADLIKMNKKMRDEGEAPPKATKLSAPIIRQLEQVVIREAQAMSAREGDNSNTQFAMMGLWVARRHGIPVQRALALVEQRFRHCQFQNGGWGYNFMIPAAGPALAPPPHLGPRMAMTCAGILAVAIGQGNVNKTGEDKKITEDVAVKAGLGVMASSFSGNGPLAAEPEGNRYYFLFSLERMAVVLDVKTIGGVEWYPVGAQFLIDKQREDGSWSGRWHHLASDTCFALLFLKKANVAPDLTANLQGQLKQPAKKPPVSPKLDDDKLFDVPGFIEKQKPGKTGVKKQSSLGPKRLPAGFFPQVGRFGVPYFSAGLLPSGSMPLNWRSNILGLNT